MYSTVIFLPDSNNFALNMSHGQKYKTPNECLQKKTLLTWRQIASDFTL